jgi:hypothetical protein
VRARSCGDARLRAPRGRPSDRDRPLTDDDRSGDTPQRGVHRSRKAEFLVATLEDLDLGDRRFDKIFAVRVGLFHRDPDRARSIVERWLAPGGAVFAFFDPPSGGSAA